VILLILSGLSAMIAMTRAGIRTFWAPIEGMVPRVLLIEIVPVAFLLLLCVAITVKGGAVMRYMEATARSLHAPENYIRDVLSAPGIPSPKQEAHK
jgi:multicomponent K+:H+ antiporter subunit D